MGLDDINYLTTSGSYSLEIHLKRYGAMKIVKWSSFKVESESEKYKLSISGFDAGTSGLPDRLKYHNGMYFSTRDKDNDQASGNCSQSNGGGWWFRICYDSHLNAVDSRGPIFSARYDTSTMILKR